MLKQAQATENNAMCLNIGALVIRTEFWGPLYHNGQKKEHPKMYR